MPRSDQMPGQPRAGPCLAMHLVIAMSFVMLLAVIATSISLITLTNNSRIVLYQTVEIQKEGSGHRSMSKGCVSSGVSGHVCGDVHLHSTTTQSNHQQEEQALQSSLEAEYNAQRAQHADADVVSESGAVGGVQQLGGEVSSWHTRASVVVQSGGAALQQQQQLGQEIPGGLRGASLSTGTTTSTSSGSGSTIEFSQGGSGLGPYYNSRLHSAVAVEPRLLSETRSTVLGALPGSDPGVDGSDEEQKPEETELEEFAEQPSLSQEMIDALQLGFKMHVPNSLTYSDVNFCPGAEEPAVEELQQMPSNKRALFMMSSNAYAKKQITAALSRHPAFRMPTNSLLVNGPKPTAPPLDVHYFNLWPLPPLQKFLDCYALEETSDLAHNLQALHTEQFRQAHEGSMDAFSAAAATRKAVAQLVSNGGGQVSRIAARAQAEDHLHSGGILAGITSTLQTAANSWVGGKRLSSTDSNQGGLAGGLSDSDPGVTGAHTEEEVVVEQEAGGIVELHGAGGVQGGVGVQGGEPGNPGALKEPILLDSTFDYWTNAAVPPRMQAMVPQARFVIILQDPVARAFEQLQALHRSATRCVNRPGVVCPKPPSFESAVVAEAASLATKEGCFFDTPGGNKTWSDCFSCAYSNVDLSHCNNLSDENYHLFPPCRKQAAENAGVFQAGNYASALGWWLSFFEPDRFLILPDSSLRNHSGMQQAISRILDHIGADPAAMPDHTAVTPGVPARLPTMPMTWLQKQAMNLLRTRYQVSEEDLQSLMDLVLPEERFLGIRHETPGFAEYLKRYLSERPLE